MISTRKGLTILVTTAVLVLTGCDDNADPLDTATPDEVQSGVSLAAEDAANDNASRYRDPSDDTGNPAMPTVEDIMPDEYDSPEAADLAWLSLAPVEPTEGNTAAGLVAFVHEDVSDERIRVVGRFINIPEGSHGFHIHETGDCSDPVAGTAGGHFAPLGSSHGDPDGPVRHVGDLGNLHATADHVAEIDFYDDHLSLAGANSIVGKAFIIHAGADDLISQPSGNSGDPIACGVIGHNEFVLAPE